MGWIFGLFSNKGFSPAAERLPELPSGRIVRDEALLLSCGGPAGTSFGGSSDGSGWAVSGLGLSPEPDSGRVWDKQSWARTLTSPAGDFPVGGHFAAARWSKGLLELFVDDLGLRTFYYADVGGTLAFSTRLDWLARFSGRRELDLATIGSRYLAFKQFSARSAVQGIERLGPGGRLKADRNGVEATQRWWTPAAFGGEARNDVIRPFEDTVRSFANPTVRDSPAAASLALSGGVDSRVILSLARRHAGFATHVFGYETEPDVALAQRIAREADLPCRWFDAGLPDASTCIDLVSDYVGVAAGFGVASNLIEKRRYPELCDGETLMLFGAGGELSRRQFLNRFLSRGGRRAILSDDRDRVADLLIRSPGPLLRIDAARAMAAGARVDLLELLETMPVAERIGAENFVDLLAARLLIGNANMAHQSLVDHLGMGFTPFEQVLTLEASLGAPVEARRRSGLSKSAIRRADPRLARYPLIAHDTRYPFAAPAWVAAGWARLFRRRQASYLLRAQVDFIRHVWDFVQELASDEQLSTDPIYDPDGVRSHLTAFERGNLSVAPAVERWLTDRLWRNGLSASD